MNRLLLVVVSLLPLACLVVALELGRFPMWVFALSLVDPLAVIVIWDIREYWTNPYVAFLDLWCMSALLLLVVAAVWTRMKWRWSRVVGLVALGMPCIPAAFGLFVAIVWAVN